MIVLGQHGGPPVNADTADLISPPTSYPAGLADGEALGRSNAPVTLEVWSDFQCPFCGQFARTYMPRLVTDFVVDGQLWIVAHDIAFVGHGDPNESVDAAAAASCAADQASYWPYHDLLFWNQLGENQGAFDRAHLQAMADKLGLERGSWDSCVADPQRAREVTATTSQALAAGVKSTPTLVLNGVAAAGLPRTYDDLAGAIRALLTAATPSLP
ncbi:MAG: DsbA family protein [Gaiellales bacterium]